MAGTGSAPVKAEGWEFDLYQVGGWFAAHPYIALLGVLVVYAFWISRRDGLLGLVIEDRRAKRELMAKTELDRARLMLKYRSGGDSVQQVPALPGPTKQPRRHQKKDGRRG